MAGPLDTATALERIRRDVERASVRTRNGLKHLAGVGRPEVGCSPKEVVWERDKVKLYRYHSTQRRIRPPLLLETVIRTKYYRRTAKKRFISRTGICGCARLRPTRKCN